MVKWFMLLVAIVVALALAACEPETVVVTKVVQTEKEVLVTQLVEVAGEPETIEVTRIVRQEVAVAATPEPVVQGPKVGGEGEVYRIATLADVTTYNVWAAFGPAKASSWNYIVIGWYYPSLYSESIQRFDFVPYLAADFPSELEQEGDFWVCTARLKEGILWSDGTAITAEDFAFTANTALKFGLSGNWEAYDGDFLDHVEAVDPLTIKLLYHTRPGLSVHQYGSLMGPIANKAYWEPLIADQVARMDELAGLDLTSDEYLTRREEIVQSLGQIDPIGEPTAGGFYLDHWEQGSYVENVRNDNFVFKGETLTLFANGAYRERWGDYEFVAYGEPTGDVQLELVLGPFFKSVLYTIYDQSAALMALTAGEVDYVATMGLTQGEVDQLSRDPQVSVAINPANAFRHLAFNVRRPPLDDVAVRRAVNCIIDKQFLTEDLLQGQAIPIYSPVPPGNAFWYNPDVTIYCDGLTPEERLNESVRILREAGYTWDVEPSWNEARGGSVDWGQGLKLPDGTAFPEMTLLAPSAGYDPLRATAGVYIEQWMRQLGMPVTAELTNFNNILDIIYSGSDWDMHILGWGLGTFPGYLCIFFETGSGFNTGGYSNPELDAQCKEFMAETDVGRARQESFELQDLLAQELPYIYLFTIPSADAWNNETVIFPVTENLGGLGPMYPLVQAVQ